MANLYLVVGHSITIETTGIDLDGNIRPGRYWPKGSQVELSPADAASLFAAGAIGPVDGGKAPEPPKEEPAPARQSVIAPPPLDRPKAEPEEPKTDPDTPLAKKGSKK